MMGMEEGDNKVTVVPREYFGDIKLERGMTLRAQTPDGQIIDLRVVDFDDQNVIVDLNHPLAGKTLIFMGTRINP